MDDDFVTPGRHGAPLIQAALALLVATTLVTFSVLAFRMGLATDRGRKVTAADVGAAGGAVVLPSFGDAERSPAAEQPDNRARVAITPATDEPVVLGTRVDPEAADADRHAKQRGNGHDKKRGRGHHKGHDREKGKDDRESWEGRSVTAREQDDDDHDHGDDDSHDSEDSGSGSGRSRTGKRHRGRGGHSGGSKSNQPRTAVGSASPLLKRRIISDWI